ncbi:hypothetical protein CIK06_25795 [Plantactinospora sp. KBS50]|nr:hypothetical protein CIK06_25795 [Plantactinospora sp. KBS50]
MSAGQAPAPDAERIARQAKQAVTGTDVATMSRSAATQVHPPLPLCRGAWSADALKAEVRDYVVEHLGGPDAVLIIDDTQMIKKGDKSVGVAPQHCGATNQVENCQVAVMLTYAGGRARVHRSPPVSAETVDRRSGPLPRGGNPDRGRGRHETRPGARVARRGARREGAVRLVHHGRRLRPVPAGP